jgi:hypothetical protein
MALHLFTVVEVEDIYFKNEKREYLVNQKTKNLHFQHNFGVFQPEIYLENEAFMVYRIESTRCL